MKPVSTQFSFRLFLVSAACSCGDCCHPVGLEGSLIMTRRLTGYLVTSWINMDRWTDGRTDKCRQWQHPFGLKGQGVRRAGLLWSQQDFEWRWSVPLFKCLTVLEFSFILFDLCLLITFFNFIMNYVPIVTFGYLNIIKFEFCHLCSVLYEVIELFIF